MKRIFLILLFVVCLIFAFSLVSMAQEMENCYYVVQNDTSSIADTLRDEGKKVISVDKLYSAKGDTTCFLYQFENSTLNLILAENVSYCMNPNPSNPWGSGIRLDMAISLNVYFNGYHWWIPDDNRYAGFFINNQGAHLTMIGNRTLEEVSANFDLSTVNAKNMSSKVDYYGGYIGFYIETGNLTIKNAVVIGEDELIYQKDNNASGTTTIDFDTCLLNNKDKSCKTVVFKSSGKTDITVKMNNVYTDKIELNNFVNGSYIKNCNMSLLYTDSWHADDLIGKDFVYINNSIITEYKTVGDTQHIIATNCTFNKIDLVGDSTGGGFATIIDCKFNESYLSLKRNTQKTTRNGVLNVITSENCVNAATKIVYTYDDDTSKIVSTLDEEYSISNPAKGHNTNGALLAISYSNYHKNGDGTYVCTDCNAQHTVTNAIKPILNCLGYSSPLKNRNQLVIGFEINNDELRAYETLMNKTMKFGVFASSKVSLQSNDILNNEGIASSGVMKTDVNIENITSFELRLTGFNTSTHKAALIAVGAVISVNDGNKTVYSYIQAAEPIENERYHFISFNELI